MSKDEMITWLLRDIESDRFHAVGSARSEFGQLSQAAEWSRLRALSYGEIEALYFGSEGPYALSAA